MTTKIRYLLGMKKVCWFIMIVMVTSLAFNSFSVYALEITEFESNPEGSDTGNEWIELYSEDEVDLEGYYLENNDGDDYDLNGSFSGYFIVQFDSQWLDNTDEEVKLKNENDEEIDDTPNFDDKDDNDNSWSKCNDEWVFIESSKGEENLCDDEEDNDDNGNDNDEDNNADDNSSDGDDQDDNSNLIDQANNNQGFDVVVNVNTNKKEKIVLNAPIKSGGESEDGGNKVFVSKQENLRLGVLIGFLVFTVLLIILLAWKRL